MSDKAKETRFDCGCTVFGNRNGWSGIDWCEIHGYFYNRLNEVAEDTLTSKFCLPAGLLDSLDDGECIMSDGAQEIIRLLLERPDVDDVLPLLKDAPAMELADGRLLLPLNIYLNKPAPEGGTLGLHVEDGVGVEDVFGA